MLDPSAGYLLSEQPQPTPSLLHFRAATDHSISPFKLLERGSSKKCRSDRSGRLGSSQHGRGSAAGGLFHGHQEEHASVSDAAVSRSGLEVGVPRRQLDGRRVARRLGHLRRRHPHHQQPAAHLDDRGRRPRLLLGLERRGGVPVAQRAHGGRRRGGAFAPAPPRARTLGPRLGRHRLRHRGALHERQGGPRLHRRPSGWHRVHNPGRRGQPHQPRRRPARHHLPLHRWTGVLTTSL